MKSRILVSVVGVPLLLYVVLFAPEWVTAAALAILSGIAAGELLECVGLLKDSRFLSRITVYAAVWTPLCAAFLPQWRGLSLLAYYLLAFAVAVYRAGEIKFAQLMAALFGGLLIPYSFSSFLLVEAAGHRGYLLLPFIFSFGSDTCAFFAGNAFGKHKLAPKVSPHKTVEGAVGGLLGDLVLAIGFVYVMNRCFLPDQAGVRHQGLWPYLFGPWRCFGPLRQRPLRGPGHGLDPATPDVTHPACGGPMGISARRRN